MPHLVTPASRGPRTRVYENSGIGVRNRPDWVYENLRNPQLTDVGATQRDRQGPPIRQNSNANGGGRSSKCKPRSANLQTATCKPANCDLQTCELRSANLRTATCTGALPRTPPGTRGAPGPPQPRPRFQPRPICNRHLDPGDRCVSRSGSRPQGATPPGSAACAPAARNLSRARKDFSARAIVARQLQPLLAPPTPKTLCSSALDRTRPSGGGRR